MLFSADGFGKFGALDIDEPWADEARRYYIGIVGKYGAQVQSLLKKASGLEIDFICPLHGPVLKENLAYYINLYNTWSSYQPEEEGIVIAYTSIYGNTKKAVIQLEEKLKGNGCPKVVVYDLARCDMSSAVSDAFRYNKLVLATTTYNADVFPFMREFIDHLTQRNFQNRTVALIENGSWSPLAAKVMKEMLANSINISGREARLALAEEVISVIGNKYKLPRAAHFHAIHLLEELSCFEKLPAHNRTIRASRKDQFDDAVLLARIASKVYGEIPEKNINVWSNLRVIPNRCNNESEDDA